MCKCVRMTTGTRRRLVWWAMAAYALLAAAVLFAPVSYGEIVVAVGDAFRGAFGMSGFGYGWFEFAANILFFMPLGFLLTLLFRRPWLGALLAVALSVAAEAIQLALPGRLASPRDILANALGAIAGALIAWLIIRRPHGERPTETRRAR